MRNPFLESADATVWPGKRLLPERLFQLDALAGGAAHRNFVKQVLQILDAVDDEGAEAVHDPALLSVLVDAAQAGQLPALERPLEELVDDVRAWAPGFKASLADQFLADLTAFGLREALAYLFAVEPALGDCRPFVVLLARGYLAAAADLVAHAEALRDERDAQPEVRNALTVPRDGRIWRAQGALSGET